MSEYSEHFFIERIFRNTIIMIEGSLGSPANKHRGGYITFCPVEDISRLFPVSDLLKRQQFNRGTCYNETIIFIVKNKAEFFVKSLHVLFGSVL